MEGREQRGLTGAGCRDVLWINRSLFPAWMLFALSLIHCVMFGIAGFLNLLAVDASGSLGNARNRGTHHSGKAFLV